MKFTLSKISDASLYCVLKCPNRTTETCVLLDLFHKLGTLSKSMMNELVLFVRDNDRT